MSACTTSMLLILLLCQCVSCLIDDDNFIVVSKAKQFIIDAFHIVATTSDYNKALQLLEYSYILHPNVLSLYHIYSWRYLLDHKEIIRDNEIVPYDMYSDFDNYEEFIYSDDVYRSYEYGVEKHYEGDYDTAIESYNHALLLLVNYGIQVTSPQFVNLLFHIGVSLQHQGDVESAGNIYNRVLKLNPYHVKTRVNIASLHHKYGNISTAITHYNTALLHCVRNESLFYKYVATKRVIPHDLRYKSSVYIMAKLNLGAAHFQLDQFHSAQVVLDEVLLEILSLYHQCTTTYHTQIDDTNYPHCINLQIDYGGGLSHLLNLQRRTIDWNLYEERMKMSLKLSAYFLKFFYSGPILPFDSLLMDVSLQQRHDIAVQHSASYTKQANKYNGTIITNYTSQFKIGFLSYDYTNHPTGHLIETIFQYIRYYKNNHCNYKPSMVCTVEVIAVSYGRDDDSNYRNSLINLADQFYNISTYSTKESYEFIYQLKLDVLLDLQLHTLGSRLNILAIEPPLAPIVVNYLVYPGTSGAKFINYIIVDHVVVPAEEQAYYTEKLIVLPPTYQIPSIYRSNDDKITSKSMLRRSLGLPASPDAIILCNFNKVDKIDPSTLSAWMNIMQRLPNSYLWLLDPPNYNEDSGSNSSIVKDHINNICAFHGISSHRVLYAPRVSKDEHVARHVAADLFLDTFIYGAHSTATDAIRGGLPVLTINGNSFPNRVVSSIYQSYHNNKLQNLLIASSIKIFVSTACYLLSSRNKFATINHLSNDIVSDSKDSGIFNNTNNILKLFGSLYTVRGLESLSINTTKKYHLIYKTV